MYKDMLFVHVDDYLHVDCNVSCTNLTIFIGKLSATR